MKSDTCVFRQRLPLVLTCTALGSARYKYLVFDICFLCAFMTNSYKFGVMKSVSLIVSNFLLPLFYLFFSFCNLGNVSKMATVNSMSAHN